MVLATSKQLSTWRFVHTFAAAYFCWFCQQDDGTRFAATCEGLTDEDARKAPLPSSPLMSVAGVVSRVALVRGHLDLLRDMADGVTGG
ncbi:hypothetical protein PJ985_00725 [Streptomyces sp. ACA25]|uniref:hypothetical protein n=1 Tax=Streptomyces sp. ACA25 TaxID=3022596 RepID=UPI002307BA2E|nr:hypothetical protein [Streptomyces sp. ACA25]MDB1086104.1 hypothetical protein [Streptomyces sp. ACA25]